MRDLDAAADASTVSGAPLLFIAAVLIQIAGASMVLLVRQMPVRPAVAQA